MCGDAPKPPPGPLPAKPPGGTGGGTGLCCACPASGAVSTDGFSNYYTTTYGNSSACVNKCTIAIVRTEAGGAVTVTKSFALSYANGATEKDHKGKVTAAITSAVAAWQSAASAFRVQVEQPGCKPQKLNILFAAVWPASGADVAIVADGTPRPPPKAPDLRNDVEGGVLMTVRVNKRGDMAWSVTHEFGHTLGLEDEYIYSHPSKSAPSVTWKGASDPDHTVILTATTGAESKKTFAFNNASVMGESGNMTFPGYLFYWLAIEVQKIFKTAGVTAVVKIVTS
jgi:hypothetical protein